MQDVVTTKASLAARARTSAHSASRCGPIMLVDLPRTFDLCDLASWVTDFSNSLMAISATCALVLLLWMVDEARGQGTAISRRVNRTAIAHGHRQVVLKPPSLRFAAKYQTTRDGATAKPPPVQSGRLDYIKVSFLVLAFIVAGSAAVGAMLAHLHAKIQGRKY